MQTHCPFNIIEDEPSMASGDPTFLCRGSHIFIFAFNLFNCLTSLPLSSHFPQTTSNLTSLQLVCLLLILNVHIYDMNFTNFQNLLASPFWEIAFFVFFHLFSLSPTKYGCFPVFMACFDHQKWSSTSQGMNMGQFSFVHFLGFCTFCRFWPFWGMFCIFGISVGVGGVLGVLVSYNITRGIKLVVGRVNYWV